MDDDDAVGAGDFPAVAGHDWLKPGIFLELGGGEQWRKLFLAKIVKNNLVTVPPN
jgi:hypothetical protein